MDKAGQLSPATGRSGPAPVLTGALEHLNKWQKALSEIRASGYNVKPGWGTGPTRVDRWPLSRAVGPHRKQLAAVVRRVLLALRRSR